MGYHRQGAFFLNKFGGRRLFSKKNRGAKNFFRKKGGEDLFTTKFENPRFHFSKRAIFEDHKVIYVGSSDSGV